jgi:hypothetical protein
MLISASFVIFFSFMKNETYFYKTFIVIITIPKAAIMLSLCEQKPGNVEAIFDYEFLSTKLNVKNKSSLRFSLIFFGNVIKIWRYLKKYATISSIRFSTYCFTRQKQRNYREK